MKVKYSYMGKMLFVDLDNMKTHDEEISEELARQYIGGYGLGARIILERMQQGVDPLSPGNIFGIGTGPLTLSGMVSSCRHTTMGKSPLTGYWGDANSGGNFANAFKGSGYDMVFFEGRANHPVYLLIRDGKAKIKKAEHIWGKDTATTDEIIRQENDDSGLKIVSIGTAGEKLSRIAAVINDSGRAAARSGLGAVMGSKNLKAVACSGSLKPDIHDKPEVSRLVKEMLTLAKSNPSGMYLGLSSTGTPGAMIPHMMEHDVPIKNWNGNNVEDFPEERWGNVAWDGMEKYAVKKYACTGCPIACGHILRVDQGKYPVERVHKPEYETLAAFGTMCLNDHMESLIYANELCNMHGLDTISAGTTIAFAIECFENGILTKTDTDGIELTWGNSQAIIDVLKKMCVREGIGDLLAEGAMRASAEIGRGSEQFAMHVGGEMVPMHDPRCTPGWGATYVSDPAPARHVRGGTAFVESGPVNETLYQALGLPTKVEKYNPEGKGEMHAVLAGWQHLVNSSGMCLFGADALPFSLIDFLKAATGWDLTYDELINTGKRISTLLHGFNLREGFKPSDFTIPPRVAGNPPLKAGALKDRTVDIEGLKRQYYEAMGFDVDTGAISKERINALGLQIVLI
ncbi:MAG: aldehyde ferredoxin oxidoreductase family protein [Deltaproteobacteria bacterium]|nr:aldehyde ferredoxin oxidoreductase family protein [Deltaproteobacteria bacterium]